MRNIRCHSSLACSALTRVSLARFTLATSILTRFQFGAFLFGALPLRRVSLWRVSQFFTNLRWSGICERQFRADCFLSAKKCFLRQFGAYLFLRSVSICAHVSYLRRSVFYASLTRFSFCAYVDRICEYDIVFSVFLMPGSLFAIFSFMFRIVRIISLLTCHRGHTIYFFISRLQNGCSTRRDVCFVIVLCSRSRAV